ncbi:MAG TPA: nodulation protein NfeD [Alphaproteobacteria bacterium]|nr:nodulation protein NfeD [Alphaproteobacteria bacterium]
MTLRLARLARIGSGGSLLFFVVLILLGLALHVAGAQPEKPAGNAAVVLNLDGVVGPATASYVTKGLKSAADKGAPVVILRMDTPGGLDSSMREIIHAILASPVPVVGYVSPSGSRAASAGTYILYACNLAAMAPGTNLGAATPVQLSGGGIVPGLGGGDDQGGDQGSQGQQKMGQKGGDNAGASPAPQPGTAEERKTLNDAIAYIRSLADLRGRNADWAEKAVREAASLPANEALEKHVINLIATDVPDLLAKIDGRTVMVGNTEVTLHTRGLATEAIQPDWRTKLLGTITNPNIALLLLAIGGYGLLFEFLNPGSVLPGTIGAIALIIGLYALNFLPINYAGLALIVLGMGLMVAEAFAPSFGILGIGGIASLVIGAGILVDTDAPGYRVAWPVIGGIAATSALLLIFVVPIGIKALRRKAVTGEEEMIGARGKVEAWGEDGGTVFVHGERWRAAADRPLTPKQNIEVVGIDGLTLQVTPSEAHKA